MPQITAEYSEARTRLYAELSDMDATAVCVEHRKFLPCRPCMYGQPASRPYSDSPEEIDKVRQHQSGT